MYASHESPEISSKNLQQKDKPQSQSPSESVIKQKDTVKAQKERLAKLMQDESEHISLLSRWAKAWGSKPWWLKAIILLVISAPTVAAAVITQIWALLILTFLIGTIYIAGSLLLDHHHYCEEAGKKASVKKAGLMMDIWNRITGMLFQSAETIHEQTEVMHGHVDRLGNEVDTLADINADIRMETEELSMTTERISDTERALAASCEKIELMQENYEQCMKKNEQMTRGLQREFAYQNALLLTKNKELGMAVSSLEIQSVHAAAVNAALKETLQKLVGTTQKTESDRAIFHDSMTALLERTQNRFDELHQEMQRQLGRLDEQVSITEENNRKVATLLEKDRANAKKLQQVLESPIVAPETNSPTSTMSVQAVCKTPVNIPGLLPERTKTATHSKDPVNESGKAPVLILRKPLRAPCRLPQSMFHTQDIGGSFRQNPAPISIMV